MLRVERRRLIAMTIFSALTGWLTGVKAKTRAFADVSQLREAVMAEVRRRLARASVVPDPSNPAQFTVVVGERSTTRDLTNAFDYIKAYPEDLDRTIKRFVNATIEDRSGSIEDGKIVVVIRIQGYINYLSTDGSEPLSERLGADLAMLYMLDHPDTMEIINKENLKGRDLNSIREIAMNNVRRWLPKVVTDNGLRSGALFYVDGNPMLSPALILFDEFWKSIAARFPGDVLIALPRKDQLFIFDDDGNAAERDGVRRLIDATFDEKFNLLSPMLYARRNGKIVIVED